MKGLAGLNGWRWIFIIVNSHPLGIYTITDISLQEGILTAVVSVAAYFFVYNYPVNAHFLTSREKEHVIARLSEDCDSARDEKFTWDGVAQAIRDPKVWLYCLGFHTMSLPMNALGFFLPTIIQELGYTAAQAQLLTIPPYVAAFILTMIVAVLAERTKLRAPFIIASTSLAIVGFIILITDSRPSAAYAGTVIAVAGIFPSAVTVVSWPANNVSGQTKRATTNAMQISIGNLGAIVGTQIYRSEWSPRYFVGYGVVSSS